MYKESNDIENPLDIFIEHCDLYNGDKSVIPNINIGIQNGKIVYMGHDKLKAKKVIDARGLIACPGFIDVHNHTDEELERYFGETFGREQLDSNDLICHNYIAQGVTTIVTGNCGSGFSSILAWQKLLKNANYGINIGHLGPYSSMRRELFGEQMVKGKLEKDDIEKMLKKIECEMAQGALGISVAFDHIPGCYATTEELIQYAKVIAKYNGVFVIHIRNESGVGIVEAILEAIKIGEQSGVRVHISQFRIYNPLLNATPKKICNLIEKARAREISITTSQNPYNSVWLPFAQYFVNHLLSNVAPDMILNEGFGEDNLVNAFDKIAEVFNLDAILIVSCEQNKKYEGKTIAQIAKMESKDTITVMNELYNMNPVPFAVAFVISESVLEELMYHDYVFTSSNGGLCVHGDKKHHPRSFGTYPKKLRQFIDHPENGDLSSAIYSMTAGPSSFFNLGNRGMIKEGYSADIVLFDRTSIGHNEDYYSNLNQYATGIQCVIINGTIGFFDRTFSKDYSGQIILSKHILTQEKREV